MDIRIQTGATEPIIVLVRDESLAPLTGKTDILLSIWRLSDGDFYDFDDDTFKASGWTDRQIAMSEVDATNAAGEYQHDWDTSAIVSPVADDTYFVRVEQSPGVDAKNLPQVGEIKVGQFLDDIDAPISGVAPGVWEEELADHTVNGTYGGEVATKSDIGAATSTDSDPAASGTVIEGSVVSGTYADTVVRDGTYWEIDEVVVGGLTVEMVFNLPSADHRPGVFSVFGRYNGNPAGTHYLELWAWNYEALAWEQLTEVFMPGGNTSDAQYTHEYFERHVDRTSGNEVTIRIVHNITTYIASHDLYLDFCEVTSIHVITAADIADAVWDEDRTEHTIADSTGQAQNHLDADISTRSTFDSSTDEVDVGAVKGVAVVGVDDFKADVSALALEANVEGHAASALATYDPPTKAELDSAVAPLALEANVEGHVTDALNSYDPPTKAEMDAGFAAVPSAVDTELSSVHGAGSWLTGAGSSPSIIADAVWDEAAADHTAAGSFGEVLNEAAVEANVAGHVLTSLNVYDPPTKAELDAAVAPLAIEANVESHVQTAMSLQGYTIARAGKLDNLDATITSVLASIAALNNLSIADVQTALTNQGYTSTRSPKLDFLDKAISALNDLSVADVQTAMTSQGYTSARAALLDNLSNLDAAITSVLTAISALNNLSQADVQAAMSSQGYTTIRAALIDNLDAAITSVVAAVASSESAIRGADGDTLKTLSDQIDGIGTAIPSVGAIADAVWDESAGDHIAPGTMGEKQNQLFRGTGSPFDPNGSVP